MREEGKGELLRTAHSGPALVDGPVSFAPPVRTAMGQRLSLAVAPPSFHRVEVGGLAGQPLHAPPKPWRAQVVRHDPAFVGGPSVPDQGGGLAAPRPPPVREESPPARGVVIIGTRLEIEAGAVALPTIGQGRAKRELLPVEGVNPGRGFAAGRPGAAGGGTFADAAFVLEDDPGAGSPSVFFTARQRSSTHCRPAAAGRSRARRVGRCSVQFRAHRIFPKWPGWYRTPVKRSIRLATRGRVHRSVPKPWARAPGRKAPSSCCSCGRSSFALRPARPAARRASAVPCFHGRYQRLTLCRLTWRVRATDASLAPRPEQLGGSSASIFECLEIASRMHKGFHASRMSEELETVTEFCEVQ